MIVHKSELAVSCVSIRHIGNEPQDLGLMATFLGRIEQYRDGYVLILEYPRHWLVITEPVCQQ